MHKQQIRHWLAQRAHQRPLAIALLTLALGCFAQALWIEAKAELAAAFSDPENATLTLVACYIPEGAQQDVALR